MKLERHAVSPGRFVVTLFTIGTALTGCFSASDGDGDDDDNGGESGEGGTSGTTSGGGTSGATSGGGTSGAGGSSGSISTGGTGSGQTSCASICQRLAACPDGGDPACVQDCTDAEAAASGLGCTAQYRAYIACATSGDVCTITEDTCSSQLAAYAACANGDPGGGGCAPSGTGPATADCATVCEQTQACPGAEPTDCATSCADDAALLATTGCMDEYQRFLGCASTCTDVCSVSDADCNLEIGSFSSCLLTFCSENPTDPACG